MARKTFRINLPIVFSVIIIALLFTGISKALSSINFGFFLQVAGEELAQDPYGHTNFMLLGTGDRTHDGGNLTDTIIVASLDNQNKTVTMLSIPRDMYVSDNVVGRSKINEVYNRSKNYYESSTEALEHTKEKLEEITGIPIHYWVKVNFQGFVDLIDALDGIEVNVEKSIYDPYYPKDGTDDFEPFRIGSGLQQLDGDTALKYARSRKTTSDFDRARRQQDILFAIKEKALSTEIILSTDKIADVLEAVQSNLDTNITIKEIFTMGSMAEGFSKDSIVQRLLHDDPTQCGGFLYTPSRELYNNMFVLIPAGGEEFVHSYGNLIFNLPEAASTQEETEIVVLNGTKTGGVAGEAKQILQRYCFNISRFGNAATQDITQTTYYFNDQVTSADGETTSLAAPLAIKFLQTLIPGEIVPGIPPEYIETYGTPEILIEIGSDYVNSEDYIDDPFNYIFELANTSAESEDETTE